MFFFLIALQFIHKLTAKLFSENIANDSVLFLAFCPAAIFFTAIYPESLYLLLIVVAFLFLENKNIFSSGITGFFAGLARPEGIFTSLVISTKSLLSKQKTTKKVKSLIATCIVLSSLLFFCVASWIIKGNYQIVFSAETSWGSITLSQVFNHPSLFLGQDYIALYAISIPLMVIGILTIFTFFIRKFKKTLEDNLFPYYLYAAFLLIFFLAIGEALSIPRFFSTIIPIYWGLSLWVKKKPLLKPLIFLLFLIQLAIGTILFVNWYNFF
jgi:hypothetical protein